MPETSKTDPPTGPMGTAERVTGEQAAHLSPTTLDFYVITAPWAHPMWSQYGLGLITLADVPGFPPAHIREPGATHELLLYAMNPEHGPYTAEHVLTNRVGRLEPINLAEQFKAVDDDQAREVAWLCSWAVLHGHLMPETAGASELVSAAWRQTIASTLDHYRDPFHGRMN